MVKLHPMVEAEAENRLMMVIGEVDMVTETRRVLKWAKACTYEIKAQNLTDPEEIKDFIWDFF